MTHKAIRTRTTRGWRVPAGPYSAVLLTTVGAIVLLAFAAAAWADDEPGLTQADEAAEPAEREAPERPVRRRREFDREAFRQRFGDRTRRVDRERFVRPDPAESRTDEMTVETVREYTVPTVRPPSTDARDGEPVEVEQPEEIFRFQFERVPYTTLVEQFAKAVDKPLIGDLNVPGELTFFDSQPYSYEEALDTLNMLLRMRGYTLMEQDRFLRLVRLSEIQRMTLPIHQGLEGTEEYGPSQIATVVLPLKFLDAEAAAGAIRPMVSEFGSAQPLARGKGVLVTDRLENIRQIRHLLDQIDTETLIERQIRTYTLRHAAAESIARIINELFGPVEQQQQRRRSSDGSAAGAAITATADTRTNSVILTGAGDQIEMAEVLIERLDTAETMVAGDLRIFKVSHGRADEIAQALNELLRTQPQQRRGRQQQQPEEVTRVVGDSATNSVIVSAPVDQMPSIEQLIRQLDEPTDEIGSMRTFPVVHAKAANLVSVLNDALGRRDERGRRVAVANVTADERTNTIIVSGTSAQMTAAEELLAELDREETEEERVAREIHVVPLQAGDARMVARSLTQLLRDQDRRGAADNIRIEAERQTNTLIISATPEDWVVIKGVLDEMEATAEDDTAQVTRVISVRHADVESLVPVLRKALSRRDERGRLVQSAQLTADERTNTLIVSGTPSEIATVTELLEQLDTDEAAEPPVAREVHVVPLKAGDARMVARSLTQLLRDQDRRGAADNVRVEAERQTNTLIISATPEDWVVIKGILDEMADAVAEETTRVTRVISLQHADANEIAAAMRGTFAPARGVRDPGQAVSISAVRGRNSLIVSASENEMKEIVEMVQFLDVAEPADAMEVRTYAMPDSDVREAARSLSRLFTGEPAPRFEADTGASRLLVSATAEQYLEIEKLIEELKSDGEVAAATRTFKLQHARATEIADVLQEMLMDSPTGYGGRFRAVTTGDVRVTAMESSNAVVVQAPAAKMSMAEELIATFDTPDAAERDEIRVIALEHAQAEDLARTLREMLPRDRQVAQQISVQADTLTNSVLIRAPASERQVLEDMIAELDTATQAQAREMRIIPLEHGSAGALANTLRQLYDGTDQQQRAGWWRQAQQRERQADRVIITPAPNDRALIVEAPRSKIEEISELVASLDTEQASAELTVRTYKLSDGSDARQLARSLQGVYRQAGRQQTTEPEPRFEGDNSSNTLLVAATRTQFSEIDKLVQELQAETRVDRETRTYKLRHAGANELAAVLRPLLGVRERRGWWQQTSDDDVTLAAMEAANMLVIQGPPEKLAMADELIKQFDTPEASGRAGIRIVELKTADAETLSRAVRDALGQRARGAEGVTVTPETNSNSVLVRGPAAELDEVVAIIRELDGDSTSDAVEVRVYPLDNGEASVLAGTVETMFRDMVREAGGRGRQAPPFSVSADVRTNSLVVSTTEAHFALVEQLLDALDKAPERPLRQAEYVWLQNADAWEVARKLRALYTDRTGADKPVIESDFYTNALTIIAREEDIKAMRQVIDQLDDAARESNFKVRVMPVTQGRADEVARQIQRIYGRMTDSGIVISDELPDDSRDTRLFPMPSVLIDDDVEEEATGGDADERSEAASEVEADTEEARADSDRADTAETASATDEEADKPDEPAPITISVDSDTNTLIVSGPSQELDGIESVLWQLMLSAETAEAEYRFFRVEKADPVAVAETLDELFNPRVVQQQQQQPQQRGRDDRDRDDDRRQPTPQVIQMGRPTITVVPDMRTRSVIVRARPMYFEMIGQIIEQLDKVPTLVSEVRVFTLRNTDAREVAENLRELFRLSGAPAAEGARGRTPQQQRAESLRQVVELRSRDGEIQVDAATMVSVSANTETNSVVVAAPADAMEIVGDIIRELDQSAAETTMAVVRMYPLRNAEVETTVASLREIFVAGAQPRGREPRQRDRDMPVVITGDRAAGQVIVSAPPDKHELIARVISDIDEASTGERVIVRVYRLRNSEARGVSAALERSLAAETGRGRTDSELRVSADQSSNTVVVRARPADHEHIAELIEQMDVAPAEELPVQIIALRNADPENAARVLSSVFGDADQRARGRDRRVVIEADVAGQMLMVRADEQTFSEIRRLASQLDSSSPVGRADQTVLRLEHADAQTVATSLQQAFAPSRGQPTRPDDLVTVVAEPYSNALIVTANERNLKRIKSLLGSLDTPEAGGARTELLLLRNARATDLAEVLSRVGADRTGREPGVTVSADAGSNALVLSGPGGKLDELMRMAMQLDQASTESRPGVYVIPLESGDAAGVAASVRDLYQQQVQAARRSGGQVDSLAVSADTRANAIVLVASESMYEQVSAWVTQVEQLKPARGTLRLIRVEHADPEEVKRAIDAIYGPGSSQAVPVRRGNPGNPGNPGGSGSGSVEVTVMEKHRSLLVGASDEEFEQIQALIAALDEAAKGAQKQIRLFRLEHATNTMVADALNQMYRAAARPDVPEDQVVVTPLRQTRAVVVTATEEKLDEVGHFIDQLDKPDISPQLEFRIYRLAHARPDRVLPMLRQMLRQVVEAQALENLHVEADERTRSIIVTAREPLFEQVAKIIEALDREPEYAAAEVAIILLKDAEAEALAAVLNEMLRPGPEGQVTPEARALQEQVRRIRLRVPSAGEMPELDLTKPIKVMADPARTGANALLISSTPENIEAMREVVAVLDRVPVAEGVRVRLMHLKSADVESVAEIVREIFRQGEDLAGRPGTVADGRAEPESMTGKALTHRLSIATDVRTNTLVLAGVEESLVLAELIVKDLDREQGQIVTEVRLFKLEHAEAARLAPILSSVFGEGAAEPETEGLRTHVTRLRTALDEGDEKATTLPKRREALVIEPDETTNILVVAARDDVMPLIADVVGSMDVPGAGSLAMVRIFALTHADANRMSDLIETLYTGPNAQLMRDEDRPTIAVDARTNSLVVWANDKTFGVIESLIDRLDSEEALPLAQMRVYAMRHADATRLAEMLGEFFAAKRSAELEITPEAQLMPLVIVPDPRTNVMMVAGSREHFSAVESMIEKLDRPDVPPAGEFRVFALEHATAGGLAPMLRELFDQRTARGDQREPVTIIADTARNALVVGAESSDMKLAESLIRRLDSAPEAPGQATKVFALRQADANQVADTVRELYEAQGGVAAAGVAVGVDERTNALIVSGGPGDIQRITDIVSRLDSESATRIAEIRVFTLRYAQADELAALLTSTLTEKPQPLSGESPNRQWLLRFVTQSEDGKDLIASALQEGVLITPDIRTNSLLVSAPLENMTLLERLIVALDSTSPRLGEIRVFKLTNADAAQLADVLRQLFRLEGDTGNRRSVRYTLRTPGAEEGESASATLGTAEEDALSVTVDMRTNSLLIGGTQHYVALAAEVIEELDASPAQDRTTRVYRLRNAQGQDVQAALRQFLDQERDRLVQALGQERMGAAQQLLEREVAIVAEETSNALLLSASPRYFETIEGMIHELDKAPPQVLIQVLLAEVTLDDSSELGIDWQFTGSFDGTDFRGGTDFDVEFGMRQWGGLSLAVTGGDINFFLRALQSQGRLEVLSRPQILAVDNQLARINIGQRVPFITQSRMTDEGATINTIQYEPIGVNLEVLPRISDDGFVKLEVAPEISSIAPSTVQITEGVQAIIVNSRSAETTVTVQDGHTIIIGGLITTRDENREDKVPILGDVPYMGNLFKSTTMFKERRELLIVLTPHVLRTTAEADTETQRQLRRLQRERDQIRRDMEYDTMHQIERSSPRRIGSDHWDYYMPLEDVTKDDPHPASPENAPRGRHESEEPDGAIIWEAAPLEGLVPEMED